MTRMANAFVLSSLLLVGTKTVLFIFSLSFRRRLFDARFKQGAWELDVVKAWASLVLTKEPVQRGAFEQFKNVVKSAYTVATTGSIPKRVIESSVSLEQGETVFIPQMVQDGAGPGDLLPEELPQLDSDVQIKATDVGELIQTKRGCRLLAQELIRGTIAGRGDGEKGLVDKEDFIRMFDVAGEATYCVFADARGITPLTLRRRLIALHTRKSLLSQSLADALEALDRLTKLIMGIIGVVCFVMISASITDVSGWVTTLVAVWAGAAFALQNSIKTLVESIIFLFLTHPFDVGDTVFLDTQILTVEKLGLMTTVFVTLDGRQTYCANTVLAAKQIVNFTRSQSQSELIKWEVKGSVFDAFKRNKLKTILLEVLISMERDFYPKCDLYVESWVGENMILAFNLEHKTNWQDWEKKVQRTSRFVEVSGTIVSSLSEA
jgi:hypothetical protein